MGTPLFRLSALVVTALGVACGGTADPSPPADTVGRSEVPRVPRTPTGSDDTPSVEVTFLDVGQGDAVLVRAPDGRAALIDAGPSDPTDQLRALGVERLELVVATHPHADHIGGIRPVLEAFPVTAYMDNGQPHTTATYQRLMRTLRDRTDITYLEATPRTLSLGAVSLEVLPLPPPDEVEHNDRSVGLVIRFGSFTVFLSGDSERRLLTHFVERDAIPDVTVLKAPHHGSRNGVTTAFLAAARPEVVILSLGSNSYGHPHEEAMRAYASAAGAIYRTDVHGRVTVVGYERGDFVVRTER